MELVAEVLDGPMVLLQHHRGLVVRQLALRLRVAAPHQQRRLYFILPPAHSNSDGCISFYHQRMPNVAVICNLTTSTRQ